MLDTILTNFKSKEYTMNDLNHTLEIWQIKGIFKTNNSNLISFPKLEKFNLYEMAEHDIFIKFRNLSFLAFIMIYYDFWCRISCKF